MIRFLPAATSLAAVLLCQPALCAPVRVTVDPRMELLGVVQFLAGYESMGLISTHAGEYRQQVTREFTPYAEHPAVSQFATMMTTGFSFDAPPTAMLHLSAPPNLHVAVPFTDYLKRRAQGEAQLLEFVEQLRDFAVQSSFMQFFAASQTWYDELVAVARSQVEDQDYILALESYFGERQASYSFVLAPLFNGGYGPRVARTDGTYDVYSILGPQSAADGKLEFGTRDSFRNWMWHEFGHSFVNPLTDQALDEVNRYAVLFDPIAPTMKKQGYGNWRTCVDEHILRATTIRLTAVNVDTETAAALQAKETRRGFVYVDALLRALERYEADRERFAKFSDFYPELIAVFRSLSQDSVAEH